MSQQAETITDGAEFAERTEPFRRELLAHCYRMLGSVDDAEDVVQETYLRAWRSHGGFEGRSSLRTWLYQIASFQYLPPRQRAVLLLRDVLAFPADDVARMLGTTTVAVKSALQRARARLSDVAPAADQMAEPSEASARALLDQYIAAFETADAAALERLLRRDAALELPPSSVWYTGSGAMATAVAGLGSPGEWRMVPTAANGQPAAATYRRGTDGAYRAHGVVVLTVSTTGIARIVVFGDPALLGRFGLPQTWG